MSIKRKACKPLSHLDYSNTGSVLYCDMKVQEQVHAAILCLLEPEEQSKPGSVYSDNESDVFGSTDGIPEGSVLQTADRSEVASLLN